MLKGIIKDLINLGLGTATWTVEKAQAVVDVLVKEGEISHDEGKGMVKELIQKGEESRHEIRQQVESIMRETLEKLNMPTRKEVTALQGELEELRKAVRDMQAHEEAKA